MARQRNPVVIRPSQRRQQSKWQREKSKQRSIIVAGVIAVVFILAIPAYGYWSNFVAPPRSVVLQVDDTKYTLGYVENYMKGLVELTGALPDLSTEPFRLLQLLEENELVRSGALARGIALDPQEVDQEIRDRILGSSSEELANVPPDQLEREFKEGYKQYLNSAHLSKKEHRRFVEASLLRDALTEVLAQEIPAEAEQAQVFWIVLPDDDPDQVQEVSQRLAEGEDFGALAEQFSSDRTSAVKGGELGWVPEGAYSPLDDTIFSLQPGETGGPIQAGNGVYFIKVTDTDESKTIEPDMRDRLEQVALQVWISQERGNHRVRLCFGGGSAGGSCDWQYDWLVRQVTAGAN